MDKFSVDLFREHIKSDNDASLAIYRDLADSYYLSLSIFPKHQNIIGVYFFDILKVLTQTLLKDKELKLGIEPNNKNVHKKLNNWPYIGYKDILEGIDLNSKSYGKVTSIKPTFLKKNIQRIINFQYGIVKKYKKKISVTSLRIDHGETLFSLQSSNLKANLISADRGWFSVQYLSSQLELLRSVIVEVMEKNNHPISSKIIAEILIRHIKADCFEGPINFDFQGDILLLNSGVEVHNRMIAVAAFNQGIPVINIQHGEAFGIYDEPPFGDLGEGAYASAFLGYGDDALKNKNEYNFGLCQNISYISSNASNVKNLYCSEFKGVNPNTKNINYFYFPTTLSGASHRYGPYRDTADSLYLSWQKYLIDLFKGNIKIKNHPKEKYHKSYTTNTVERVTGKLNDLNKQIDVFIFDYAGTAFNEACATDKPIIYFDLGIRNTAPDVLDSIKNRTIYFNINDDMPSLTEIEDRIFFNALPNHYSLKYSLTNNNKSRTQSLSDGIEELYG